MVKTVKELGQLVRGSSPPGERDTPGHLSHHVITDFKSASASEVISVQKCRPVIGMRVGRELDTILQLVQEQLTVQMESGFR